MHIWRLGGLLTAVLAASPAVAETASIPEIVVSGRRLAPAASEQALATTVIDAAALESAGTARLDDALRDVPGFSLFRRQSSRASHPTTQGVTLRGLGPSGAGRTLVLLDGVPQNDPFGGWIDWSRLPPTSLDSVVLTRGGGAGPWGNAALSGTLRLNRRVQTGAGAEADVRIDSFGAGDGAATGHAALGKALIAATLAGHGGDGPYLLRADQRGPVDVRTADRGGLAQATVDLAVDDATRVGIAGTTSNDVYVNGLALAKSRSRISDGALGIVHDAGRDAIGWEVHAFLRGQNLPATFTSVNAARTLVTPSLDQFRVPANAAGGNLILRMPVDSHLSIDVGGDLRRVDGETDERFQYVGSGFTRLRVAGGAQTIGGAFLEANWTPSAALTFSAAGRIDAWRQSDGRRTESALADGTVLRNDRYQVRTGTVGNGRFGARVALSPDWTLRAAAYSGFRVPTLNELYRPFRVGNDITEANPDLKPERLYGAETGLRWTPTPDLAVDLTLFVARLSNAVGNITVRSAPGLDPILNVVVPAGGVLRQRRNIDRIRSEGVEASVAWTLGPRLDLDLRYLYNAPRIARSADQPGLAGLDLAQVARHQGFAALRWRPWSGALWRAEGHLSSFQYEDDLNSRRLAGYVTLDLYAEQALTPVAAIYLSAANLFDRTVEAGRSADGLVTVGMSRTVAAGVRLRL